MIVASAAKVGHCRDPYNTTPVTSGDRGCFVLRSIILLDITLVPITVDVARQHKHFVGLGNKAAEDSGVTPGISC